MSVVVAVRDTDRIWLATDSQVTSGWTKSLLLSKHSFKIFKFPSKITIGGVGSLRDLNILSTSDVEFISEVNLLKDDITFKSLVRETVPKIFEELHKFHRVTKEDGVLYMESMFVIAYKECCYMICEDGAVLELNDMFAIGSGGNVAESAYTILRDTELSPKEKAVRAVISSCERDLFVDFPIVVTNTLTDEFEIFDGNDFYRIDESGELILIPDENESTEDKIKALEEEEKIIKEEIEKVKQQIQECNDAKIDAEEETIIDKLKKKVYKKRKLG